MRTSTSTNLFFQLLLSTSTLTAVTTAFSLTDISPISANSVTPGCLTTYSESISSCPDLTTTIRSCSDSCKTALLGQAAKLIVSCRQAFVGPDTVLRRVLDGGIIGAVCTKDASSSSSPVATTSTPDASDYPQPTSFSGILTMSTDVLTLTPIPTGTDGGLVIDTVQPDPTPSGGDLARSSSNGYLQREPPSTTTTPASLKSHHSSSPSSSLANSSSSTPSSSSSAPANTPLKASASGSGGGGQTAAAGAIMIPDGWIASLVVVAVGAAVIL